jgi:creatinine amidohydrolase
LLFFFELKMEWNMKLKHMRPDQLKDAVARGCPLLVPAGCIEVHGPHMAIGHDTLIVEEVCRRIAAQVDCVIAPSIEYGPTGYAVSGPEEGTIDVDYASFGLYSKSILRAFCEMNFRTIVVIIMHQGMDGPLALALRKGAAELAFERRLETRERGWWGARRPTPEEDHETWGRIVVRPMILPAATPPANGDHAGYYETSFLLAAHPQLVDQSQLSVDAPWYCEMDKPRNSATATAEFGEIMLKAVVDAWVNELAKLQ